MVEKIDELRARFREAFDFPAPSFGLPRGPGADSDSFIEYFGEKRWYDVSSRNLTILGEGSMWIHDWPNFAAIVAYYFLGIIDLGLASIQDPSFWNDATSAFEEVLSDNCLGRGDHLAFFYIQRSYSEKQRRLLYDAMAILSDHFKQYTGYDRFFGRRWEHWFEVMDKIGLPPDGEPSISEAARATEIELKSRKPGWWNKGRKNRLRPQLQGTRFHIEVTAEDIERSYYARDPVMRALFRRFRCREITFDAHKLGFTYYENDVGTTFEVDTPDSVWDFVNRLHEGMPVKPFGFYLKVPADFVHWVPKFKKHSWK